MYEVVANINKYSFEENFSITLEGSESSYVVLTLDTTVESGNHYFGLSNPINITVDIMVNSTNTGVIEFHKALGALGDEVISYMDRVIKLDLAMPMTSIDRLINLLNHNQKTLISLDLKSDIPLDESIKCKYWNNLEVENFTIMSY